MTTNDFNAVFSYATDGEKCFSFKINEDGNGAFVAVAVCEYGPENVRLNKFYFDEKGPERGGGYFGPGSLLRFLGSTSAPLVKTGANKYTTPTNETVII